MTNLLFRNARIDDIPFLVETIIEAEKSGSDKLSYSTVFGLSHQETQKYLSEILLEEIDGCELSLTSFLLVEIEGKIAGATASWIEGLDDISSAVLKGNLLNYTLPKECIKKAIGLNNVLNDIQIDCVPGTIQLGLVYVATEYRGMKLAEKLIKQSIKKHCAQNPEIDTMYVQVFGNNTPAIKAYTKMGFAPMLTKESTNLAILQYLPFNQKQLLKYQIRDMD